MERFEVHALPNDDSLRIFVEDNAIPDNADIVLLGNVKAEEIAAQLIAAAHNNDGIVAIVRWMDDA